MSLFLLILKYFYYHKNTFDGTFVLNILRFCTDNYYLLWEL